MTSLADLPFNPTDNSVGAELAQGALYGENEEALGWRMLEHVPNATSVAGWNAWRASNTIMNAAGDSKARGRIRNHLPGNLTKMSSYDNIGGVSGAYTPFDFLARSGNWMDRAITGRTIRPGAAPDNYEAKFGSGTYSRLSTASRLSYGGGPKARTGAEQFLKRTSPNMVRDLNFENLTNRDLGDLVSASSRGTWSQAASGYVRGAMHGPLDEKVASRVGSHFAGAAAKGAEHRALGGGARALSREAFKNAARTGTAKAAAKGAAGTALKHAGAKAAAKYAGATALAAGGWAVPGVNIALAVWTAVDLTKMALEVTRAIPGLARDSINSFKGGIQKPVFGSRYVDNSVAATSRQRGVMAIQNSQLNMRSALGNEAAGLHAYYG